MAHPSIMMRRGIVDRGYRYDETLKMSEDLDLWLRLMNDGNRVANISETVLNYRVTDSFLMKRSNRKQREYMEFVRKKNFCVNHLFHSVLSNTAGWLFLHTPASVINRIYSKENKQKRER